MFWKKKSSASIQQSFVQPEFVEKAGMEAAYPHTNIDFSVLENGIIYNQGENGYSIAIGRIENRMRVAIRWNGDSRVINQGKMEEVGVPQNNDIGVWFVLPEFLAGPTIAAVVNAQNS